MKIGFFKISNFCDIIGAAEPYYLFSYLRKVFRTRAYVLGEAAPDDKESGITVVKRLGWLPATLCFNLLVICRLLKEGLPDYDLIYTYHNVWTPVFFYKYLRKKKWVVDFRRSPLGQTLEFRKILGRLNVWHRLYYALLKKIWLFMLPSCDLVVVISEELAREMINEYGVAAERIYVQPVGVDTTLFRPGSAAAGDRLPVVTFSGRPFTLLYVGSIAVYRGLDTVIKAMALLRPEIDTRLVIIGSDVQGEGKSAAGILREQAAGLGLDRHISWRGKVPHQDIPALLAEGDVAVSPLPRIRSFELSAPIKVIEYLAAGKIVAASDILAHRQIIKDGENGLLFEPGDPAGLAELLKWVYRHPDKVAGLCHKARRSAMPYDWHVMFKKLEERIGGL